MAAKNHAEMKERNVRTILRTLRLNGESSRATLSEQTELTPSTVSTLTHELIQEGFIEEAVEQKQQPGRGRPPIILRLRSNTYAALGVEIGPKKLKLGVMDLTGELYHQQTAEIEHGPMYAFDIIRDFCREQVQRLSSQDIKVAGLGVAVSGLVDPEQAIGRYSSILGWTNVDFRQYLKGIDVPVFIDNNVRFMALGEQWYGRFSDCGSLILVQVGLGVGCAMVLQEHGLIRGDNNNAGELGHSTVLPGGPRCRCGKQGCLEALVSEGAITDAFAKRAICRNHPSPYASLERIVGLADSGDDTALEVLKEGATYLGISIANLINVFDITRIVLNGNAFILSPRVQDWIWRTVNEHRISGDTDVQFYASSFREMQAVVGACTSVFVNRFF